MLFILNTGRAGSRTIANVLSQHPEIICVHEPVPRLIEECANFRYGNLPASDLGELLRESRPAGIDGRRYGESANRLSLAVPVLAETFPDSQFIWLMRDGQDVVSSGMQRGWFNPDRVRDTPWERFRLRADRLGETTFEEWEAWSPFRRISWLWNRTNRIIGDDLDALAPERSMRLRLEDLSSRMDDVASFLDISTVDWVVPRLNARSIRPDTGPNTANQVAHRFSVTDWTEAQVEEFELECGVLMDQWYQGWKNSEESAPQDSESGDETLSSIQVELAGLRTVRGELNLLTTHSIREDRRQALLRAENDRLSRKLQSASEKAEQRAIDQSTRLEKVSNRLHKSERRSSEAERRSSKAEEKISRTESLLAAERANKDKLKRRLVKSDRRVQMVEASESYRLGHKLVQTATFPLRLARAVRRRLDPSPQSSSSKKEPTSGNGSKAKSQHPVVAPDTEVGFADLDRLDPSKIEPGALQSFRLTTGDVNTDHERVKAAIATLAANGTGRILIRSSTTSGDITATLGTLMSCGREITVDVGDEYVELVVGAESGPPDSLIEDALLAATKSASDHASTRAEVTRLKRTIRSERKTHESRIEHAQDSTQYRIGAALLDVVHRPTAIVRLPREFRALQKRRSNPQPASKPTQAEPPALGLRVVSILDEFTHDCFAPEFDLISPTRNNWREEVPQSDLVFIESAWRGNNSAWKYTLNKFEKNGSDVQGILDLAGRNNVPTLFWNKEDPVSFDLFLPAASSFDYVLTTDQNVVDNYKEALGHDRVASLPFAAQPRLHNPIGRGRDLEIAGRVCFAGSWRGDKYAQRGSDFDVLLGPPLERGALDIYDRYASGPDADRLGFPEPFRSAVVGSLPYSEIGSAYRRYAAFLNVNSVQDSPTMFSRRVFELLACGTPVISTPSLGIDEMLGDAVLVTDTRERTSELLDWVLNEPEARDRHAHLGYRLVHQRHTYEKRVDSMLDQVGIIPTRSRKQVTVVCVSNRPTHLDHALDNYLRQSYEDKEFVFVVNSREFNASMLESITARIPGARVLEVDESATLADGLNEALQVANARYFAKFDDDDHYGTEYLSDLMMTFPYSGAAVAGKQSYYAYLEGQDRTVLRFPGKEFKNGAPRVVGGTIVADRSQIGDLKFEPIQRGTDSKFLEAVRARGLKIFSADRYNFCQVRHADVTSHTWAISDDEFLKACVPVGPGLDRDAIFI